MPHISGTSPAPPEAVSSSHAIPSSPPPSTLSSQETPRKTKLTVVNGKGLWKSWTRNFKTPLLALLDLIDNSVDATIDDIDDTFRGCIYVMPDIIKSHKGGGGGGGGEGTVTGALLINNSRKPIKSLQKILEVYGSEGKEGHDAIGENGVGLKQGCATLSDLSFVLSKSQGRYSLGIIARALQKDEGCCLPSFEFESIDLDNLEVEMEQLFSMEEEAGICVRSYGGGNLQAGVRRLVDRFDQMSGCHPLDDRIDAGEGTDNIILMDPDADVFCIILHGLKHGGSSDVISVPDGVSSHADCRAESVRLMEDLASELPHHYIHIPETCDIRVNGKKIVFYHWQQRLVDMSTFIVHIDENVSFEDAPNDYWKDTTRSGYPLRMFLGFDFERLSSKQKASKSCASLLIYSRSSGRLIKSEEDGRPLLGLASSGTHFSQGLTIIVDDYNGKLPLNPTKQDIAFGERANGDIHKKNLHAWMGAVTSLYYNHRLEVVGKGLKKRLTDLVLAFALYDGPVLNKPLSECDFNRYSDVRWFKHFMGSIRVKKSNLVRIAGSDSLMQLEPPKGPRAPKERRSSRGANDNNNDKTSGDSDDDTVEEDDSNDVGRPERQKKKVSKNKKMKTPPDDTFHTEPHEVPTDQKQRRGSMPKKKRSVKSVIEDKGDLEISIPKKKRKKEQKEGSNHNEDGYGAFEDEFDVSSLVAEGFRMQQGIDPPKATTNSSRIRSPKPKESVSRENKLEAEVLELKNELKKQRAKKALARKLYKSTVQEFEEMKNQTKEKELRAAKERKSGDSSSLNEAILEAKLNLITSERDQLKETNEIQKAQIKDQMSTKEKQIKHLQAELAKSKSEILLLRQSQGTSNVEQEVQTSGDSCVESRPSSQTELENIDANVEQQPTRVKIESEQTKSPEAPTVADTNAVTNAEADDGDADVDVENVQHFFV